MLSASAKIAGIECSSFTLTLLICSNGGSEAIDRTSANSVNSTKGLSSVHRSQEGVSNQNVANKKLSDMNVRGINTFFHISNGPGAEQHLANHNVCMEISPHRHVKNGIKLCWGYNFPPI